MSRTRTTKIVIAAKRYYRQMRLLLIDLDGTLIDWSAVFARWAAAFVAEYGGTEDDIDWLVTENKDGYAPREELASAIASRFGLTGEEEADLLGGLRDGMISYLALDDAVVAALAHARAAGWVPFVVTNGTVAEQEHKLRLAGLDRYVTGWVISEGAGVAKPDRAIFELAAAMAGLPLDGAWMIGDSADHDIEGAHSAGLDSIWLTRGRNWPYTSFTPTRMAASFPEAISDLPRISLTCRSGTCT
jgi:putative hydrolase of the HAD superfamily